MEVKMAPKSLQMNPPECRLIKQEIPQPEPNEKSIITDEVVRSAGQLWALRDLLPAVAREGFTMLETGYGWDYQNIPIGPGWKEGQVDVEESRLDELYVWDGVDTAYPVSVHRIGFRKKTLVPRESLIWHKGNYVTCYEVTSARSALIFRKR